MSRMKKALFVATVAVAGAVALPTSASAGIYTWKYAGSYPSSAACQSAGPDAAAAQDADAWRCSATSTGANLYLGYIW
ncbi:MAG: hypothetical protein HOV77_06300 [Hamadaea sp.]|uniref:hypothetical protein n=1 Tax=Hamadaea sp. TaxID=2024425 RepID=UPI00180F4E56|nr:hypothetical protein [Hamadaea sp.]NUT18778.1 hypothetical protein [Hamadaea sp.]